MLSRLAIMLGIIAGFITLMLGCVQNHPPTIESIIGLSDSIRINQEVEFEAIIIDEDNDVTRCYWFFNGVRAPEFDRKTKITWRAPNQAGTVAFELIVDDGKSESSYCLSLNVY